MYENLKLYVRPYIFTDVAYTLAATSSMCLGIHSKAVAQEISCFRSACMSEADQNLKCFSIHVLLLVVAMLTALHLSCKNQITTLVAWLSARSSRDKGFSSVHTCEPAKLFLFRVS